MSKNASMLCDGNGVSRVVSDVIETSLTFENASLADAQFIYDARYADGAAKYYRNEIIPSFEEHVAWLNSSFKNDDRILANVVMGTDQVGHVRIDKIHDQVNAAEIGICLAPNWRGKRMGKAILSAANQYFAALGFSKIYAEIHKDNIASSKIFNEAGYEYLSADNDGFMRYLWQA